MKLMVLGTAYFPSEAEFRLKCWIFLRSCQKFGIGEESLRFYGIGATQYTNLFDMRITGVINFLNGNAEDFTHVLVTDVWDVFFASGLDEIIGKYKAAGSPKVLARIDDLQGFCKQAEGTGYTDDKGRAPTSGSYIAEIPYLVEALSKMQHVEFEDLWSWIDGYKQGFFHPTADWNKDIFQNTPDYWELELRNGRFMNTETGTFPSLFHFGGEYCDPDTGKDYLLRPWVEKIGVIGKGEPRSLYEGPICLG